MLTGIVVGILGFLLVIVLIQLFRKPQPVLAPGPPAAELANLTIADARAGDAVSIAGAGADFADVDFTVDRRTEYSSGEKRWFDLSGMWRTQRVRVEVSGGDEIEVHAALDPKTLTIEELGLAEEELAAMDDRQNTGDYFEFDGKTWCYRFSREVSASPDGGHASPQPAARSYWWRFEEEGGRRFLTVRKPESEPFAATVSVKINPGDVTVYRAG